jgi:hypothetical protein
MSSVPLLKLKERAAPNSVVDSKWNSQINRNKQEVEKVQSASRIQKSTRTSNEFSVSSSALLRMFLDWS